MEQIFLALGSNEGDRFQMLMKARQLLAENVGKIIVCSTIIETEAVGFLAPPFLNQVLVMHTHLDPFSLLQQVQFIEQILGRTQKTKYIDGKPIYHNRTIDIDILEYGNLKIHSEQLTIPHPRMYERDFVMTPLTEVKQKLLEKTPNLHTEMIDYNYVVIEGCIGAGKTSLSKMLSSDFNAQLILERFVDNSFLPKFYKDPEHYAFPVEMAFLTDRYQQLKTLLSQRDLFTNLVISDYFIDKCIIFSKNNLQNDEYNLFLKVYDIISTYLPRPDLLVYLYKNSENLLKNIALRGRDFEKDISAEYLESIQNRYITHLKQITNIPILIIDSDQIDFVNNAEDYQKIRQLFTQKYPMGINRITF